MCRSKFKHCPRHLSVDTITAVLGEAHSTQLGGQKAVEEIDRLEKATVSHVSLVFPIRVLQCCRSAGDNIIKHERLPGLWTFMASVSISAVFFMAERVVLQDPETAREGILTPKLPRMRDMM